VAKGLGWVAIALLAWATPGLAQSNSDLFTRAHTLERQGDWQGALSLWASAPDSAIGTGRSDPRIGPAFIATAIENDARDRLEEASALYLWSFSAPDPEADREHVTLEARRITPLLTLRDSARWQPLLEGDTPTLSMRIARYWLEHDPTPETVLNERLVEHWQRIVEARKRYQYNRSSVYETDDRGIIFVKYGPPGTRNHGFLGSNEMELKIRVADPIAREVIRRMDPHPQFDLWKYAGLNAEEYTFYLFGNVWGTGPFELVEGPLDLISSSARNLSSASKSPGGVRVQYYHELFYYRDLAILGGRFGRRFDELATLWDGYTMRRNAYGAGAGQAPTAPTLQTYSYRFAEEDRYAPEGVPSIEVRSEYEGAARAVEMVVQPVRVLDPSDQPMIVVQALSAPRLRLGDRAGAGYVSPLRDTEHTLILRNREMEEAGRMTQLAPARVGGVSVFRLRHPSQPVHLTVYAKAIGSPVMDADTMTLAGQGHAYIDTPLVADASVFEVSDLAVGTPVDAGALEHALPFPLLPSARIWTGDALRVYLELYHLTADAGGTARYDLRFRLLPLDDVGEVKSSPPPVTLGIQLESFDERAQRHFDIGLAGLEIGLYRLEVDATDLVSGGSRSRATEIEIIG
jgi:GWxTD domain-containing protein